nr:zinc knuckle CX2CX4HX4C [Tanacetum cinerariifolium]
SCILGGWFELLGTQIGKPIMLDAFTSSMCVESWDRISFARALIEIDAVVGLKNESRKKNKGANFGGIRLNKPKCKVMWQQKKGMDAKSNSTSPSTSSNPVGNDKGVLNLDLNTSNLFDVLNMDGDDMGESGTQPKVSKYVNSDLNDNRMEASKTSSSKSVYGDDHKDKNISSPTVLKKWDVINEDDTTDDEDVFTSYGGYVGGGNQLEDGDFNFYEGYADQVVDLDSALKEFRDFKLNMSGKNRFYGSFIRMACHSYLVFLDVINEDDTTDDEDVFTSYGGYIGGGNQLEDEDFDFYEGYADQVVDLDGALKEFHDFKLSMSDMVFLLGGRVLCGMKNG